MKTSLDEAQEVLLDMERHIETLSVAGYAGFAGVLKGMSEKARALIAQAASPVVLMVLDDSVNSGLPSQPRLWFLGATAPVQMAVVIQDEKVGSSFQLVTAEPVVRKSELFEVACDLLASEIQSGTVPLASVQQITD